MSNNVSDTDASWFTLVKLNLNKEGDFHNSFTITCEQDFILKRLTAAKREHKHLYRT